MADSSVKDQEEEQEKTTALKLMSEPVLGEMSEELRRTKRNFLALASLIIFYKGSGIPIEKAAPFGIDISKIDPQWILWILLIVGVYLGIQFTWLLFNYYLQERVRLTGPNAPSVIAQGGNAFGSPNYSPSDSRQSSLYFWWATLHENVSNIRKIEEPLRELAASLNEAENSAPQNPQDLKRLVENVIGLNNNLKSVNTILSDPGIPEALDRFNHGFHSFTKSQRLHFFCLNVAVPIIASVSATASLFIF